MKQVHPDDLKHGDIYIRHPNRSTDVKPFIALSVGEEVCGRLAVDYTQIWGTLHPVSDLVEGEPKLFTVIGRLSDLDTPLQKIAEEVLTNES
jgi:hypothetical protein